MAARGTITFNITDYKTFIKLNRLISFELDDFYKQIKDALTKYIKGVITNIPVDKGIPVLQMERKILEINEIVSIYLKLRLENDFGVNMKGFDLANIEVDKESEGYAELRKVTAEQTTKTTVAQADVNIKNLEDMQGINAQNMEEILRVQREEAQEHRNYKQKLILLGHTPLTNKRKSLKQEQKV